MHLDVLPPRLHCSGMLFTLGETHPGHLWQAKCLPLSLLIKGSACALDFFLWASTFRSDRLSFTNACNHFLTVGMLTGKLIVVALILGSAQTRRMFRGGKYDTGKQEDRAITNSAHVPKGGRPWARS